MNNKITIYNLYQLVFLQDTDAFRRYCSVKSQDLLFK